MPIYGHLSSTIRKLMFGGTNLNKQIMGVTVGAVGGFLACWMFVGMSGCGKGVDVMAVVNGESITLDDYYKYLEFKPDVRVITQSGVAALPPEGTLGFQALQDLIGQRVTIQLAKDNNMFPSDADVTKELEFKKKLNPNYLGALTQRGYTFDMIRNSLTLDLIRERMLTKGMVVTQADVDSYVKANPKEFIEPQRADIRWILVQDKQTQKKVDQEITGGQDFSQVAKRYSAAPDVKENDARLTDKNTGGPPATASLPANVQTAIKNFKGGETTEWIPLVDGFAKFFVKQIMPERPLVMDDAKKELLRRLLAQKKGSEGRDINRQVLVKLKDSKIEVRKTAFQKPWEEAYRKFMVENKLEGITGSNGQ